jgi:hypothetical protein
MRKCLAGILLLLAASALADTASVQHQARLHALPDATARVKATLEPGTVVELLAHRTRAGFAHVVVQETRRRGWVRASNLSERTPAAPAPATLQPEAAPAIMAAGVPANAQDRAHDLAKRALSVHGNLCQDVSDEASCHRSYAEGCTINTSNNPNTYDAYLSFVKNQTPKPDLMQPVAWFRALADVTALDDQARAAGIGKQHEAELADELADMGQGNLYGVEGFLYYAQPGGIETCNCKLTNPDDIDFHLGIGFDPTLAADIADGTVVVTTSGTKTDEVKQTSMIVEMTPHYRAKYHPTWTLPQVEGLAGRRVRVIGQLLTDNEHNTPSQNCAFPDADKTKCWRASTWELHPVMQFFVCKPNTSCTSDGDWDDLDNLAAQ